MMRHQRWAVNHTPGGNGGRNDTTSSARVVASGGGRGQNRGMIISASRRTDIPAFYSDWLRERLRRGFCLVPNPFNPRQVARVSLRPADVDALVLWSKNPRPLLDHLEELVAPGYPCYFQFTLNDYPRWLEPGVPALAERLETFRRLARHLGPERVVWRYDPLVFTSVTTHAYHRQAFRRLVDALAGHSRRVVVSIVDFYRKTERRLGQLAGQGIGVERRPRDNPLTWELLEEMRVLAAGRDLEMFSCADDLSRAGIPAGACIDAELLGRLGRQVSARKDPGQRPTCRCAVSRDIGMTDTCRHGCRYCYATRDPALAARRHSQHRPRAPVLWQASPAGWPAAASDARLGDEPGGW